jgi:hypothetical protein
MGVRGTDKSSVAGRTKEAGDLECGPARKEKWDIDNKELSYVADKPSACYALEQTI